MNIEHWRDANDTEKQITQIRRGKSGPGIAFSPKTTVSSVNYHSTDVPDSFICQPELEKFSHQWVQDPQGHNSTPTRQKHRVYCTENTHANRIA